MSNDALKALKFETEFLSGIESNFEAAKGKQFRGSSWQRSKQDDSDRLRAMLAEARKYDRELLKSLPANRRVALRGYERRFLFWKKQTGVAIGAVVSPLQHYVDDSGGEAPPTGLGDLLAQVRELTGDRKVQHLLGICSPTGFTEEARNARFDEPNVTVVLVEPDGRGGWNTLPTSDEVDPRLLKIFDPEGPKQKVERVKGVIDEISAELLTGGLSASQVARRANLPEQLVKDGFETMAQQDAELKLTQKDGEVLLYRGAPVPLQEKPSMNVIDRIRQLFAGDGDDFEKINVLAERRAALAQRRDRIYEDIGKLEKREGELLEEGKAAKSAVPRRRLAAQLAQLRKDIARQNATASMLNQQINIISTDIHNLTLIQQGQMAKLPDSNELTEHAVEAEEMLETLKADADLVGSLESNMEDTLASDEELAILREFEAADAPPAAAPPASTPPASAAPAQGQVTPPAAETPPNTDSESARAKQDPEAN